MKVPTLAVTTLLLATTATAQSNFPPLENGWGITDFTWGALSGLYFPLQMRANDYDCQSQFTAAGERLIPLSVYFNREFAVDFEWLNWAAFAIDIVTNGYALYALGRACHDSY